MLLLLYWLLWPVPLAAHWSFDISYDPQLSGTELPYGHIAAHVSYCLNKTLIYNILSDSITVGPHHLRSSFFGAISLICCLCEFFPFNFFYVSIFYSENLWFACLSLFFAEMTHHFLKFRLWVKILLSSFEIANIKIQNQWKGQTYSEM